MLNFEEKILFHVSVLWTFSEGMFAPLFALFTDQIGGSVLTVSWAWAAYMIISGIGMIIVGKISDGMHKASLMFAGYAIITLATFSYLLISTPIHLLLVQLLMGVGLALTVPTWYALYDQCSGGGEKDGYVWGLAQGMWQIISGVAIVLGGVIVFRYSFDALFITMGVVMAIATLYQVRLLWTRAVLACDADRR